MVAEQQFQGRWKALVGAKHPAVARKVFIFICAVAVVLSGSCLFAAEQEAVSGAVRHRVFSLKHISAEQGKKYLAEVGVGTVSQLPGLDALLVTAQPQELIKASAILELVDAEELFYIKAIFPVSEVKNLASNEQIAAEVGDISIGTFSEPPTSAAKSRAIIDVHNDAVIAIAPAGQLERIISAIEHLQGTEAQALRRSEPDKSAEMDEASEAETETITEAEIKKAEAEVEAELKRIAASSEPGSQADEGDDESDRIFNKLLKSIADAEKGPILQKEGEMETQKMVAEQAQQLSQPGTVATVPDANGPNEPSVDLKQTEESAFQTTKEPQSAGHLTVEPNLPAVGSLDKGAAEEPKAEPEPKSVSKVRSPSPLRQGRGSYGPKPIADGNEMLELDLPEKLNVIDLVDLVGKYLKLDYMYDETKVKGEVALKLQGPIKIKDLYPLLESVLKFKGFVMTRRGNLVTIAPADEAVGLDPVLHPEEVGEVQLGDVVITRVFKLKHIDTASAQNLLSGMQLGADISPIPETRTLIVTGYAYRMARVEELLQMVDKPGEPKQFRFRQLKYTMATTLAPKIKTLAEQLGTVSITIAAPSPVAPPARPTRGRPVPTPPAPAEAKPAVYLDADERTNRILMIGLEEQLIVVDSLIDTLDVEQQDLRSLRLYDIQHVGAEEVVEKLGELGIIGGGRPTARTSAARPGAPAPPATAEIEPLVEEPQVVIIESTNSLLVNATAEQHARIAEILAYVDSETLEQAIPYVIYPLENQSPEDLAGVLQKLIQETIKDKEGKIERTIKRIEEDIVIVPDESTFSIIVYASRKNQEWIGNLIKQLDKRRPQVLIDVSLVEITKEEDFEYDLSLLANVTGDLVKDNIAIIGGSGLLPVDAGGRSSIIEAGFNLLDSDGFPTKRVKGFYNEGRMQALFDAIDKKGYGRILARPKVLVNDNEEGLIKTTEKTHVGEETQSWPGEGTTPVTTTKWTPYEAKIELAITPNISEGDLLRLEINMLREDFQRKEEGPPDYTTSNVATIVTVPDGSTIILGGLTKLKQAKAGSKVPLLGDIPLVGGLFRTVANSDKASKLYIFVKANILRPEETVGLAQLQRISERNRAAFEEAERRFQEHQSVPGIEPEPIEPLRVLEAE